MSDFDSPEEKNTDKPRAATQQLRNLLNALLDEEGCPEKDRLTAKERAWLEEMRMGIDESRIGEAEAKNILKQEENRFLAIVGRGITKKDIESTRQMIKKTIEEHKTQEAAREARLDWEAGGEPGWSEKTRKKKPPGCGYVM